MNKYFKEFLHRGLMFSGFGPIIAGIIYFIVSKNVEGGITLTASQVLVAIVSTYLLAFIHAGVSVFNQMYHWPLLKSVACHFACLYLAYALCYIFNSWIPFVPQVLLIFTAIFVAVYLVVWFIVFIVIKATSKNLNKKIS